MLIVRSISRVSWTHHHSVLLAESIIESTLSYPSAYIFPPLSRKKVREPEPYLYETLRPVPRAHLPAPILFHCSPVIFSHPSLSLETSPTPG